MGDFKKVSGTKRIAMLTGRSAKEQRKKDKEWEMKTKGMKRK